MAGVAETGATVAVSPDLAALEGAFVAAVRTAKETDPVAPVLVVVGSHLQHLYLRRLLARSLSAVANVRFLSLMDLAGELSLAHTAAGISPTSPEPVPLPEGAHIPLLEQVIAQHRPRGGRGSNFGLADTSMVQAVAATLRDLREGCIEARHVAAGSRRPWLRDLVALADAHEAAMAPFIDGTRRVQDAAAATEPEVVLALQRSAPGAERVLVYGIYDVNALQLELLARLAEALPVLMFLPWQEAAEPFAFAGRTIARLCERGFRLTVLDDDGGTRGPRGVRAVFSCADRQAEIEETVRRVLEDMAGGVPAAEIAILHRLDQVFDELISGVLDRAGVPYYRSAGRPVRRSIVGRAALILLHLLYEEPRRGPLLELLSLPDIDLTGVEPDLRARPARWEALSKELGLVQGWQEFDTVLAFHQDHAAKGDRTGREEESAQAARELHAVVRHFGAAAERALAAATWREHAAVFMELLGQLMPTAAGGHELATIDDRLRGLTALDNLTPRRGAVGASAPRFHQAAETAIRQAIVSGGYFQRSGVFVGNVMGARMLRFRRVYVAGCSERTFPPVIRQDPLLLDAERERINLATGPNRYLPIKGDRLDEERLLFELACQAGTERLTLSYPRRGTGSTTVRLPSSFLLEEVGDLAGGFLSAQALEQEPWDWSVRMPSRIGYHGTAPDAALRALDTSDLRFHVLEHGHGAAMAAVAPLWPNHQRLVDQRTARRERRFGAFDGITPADLVSTHGVLTRDLTPSALADYAVCPYRFFLSRVLGIRARSEPEQTLELAPLQRGNLVHDILDELVQEYLAGEAGWAAFLSRADEPLRAIMARQFTQLPAGVTGLPLTWRLIRDQVAAELHAYLDGERDHAAAESGWQPLATERTFRGVPIPAGECVLTFSGRIDRLDRSATGLRVVDYKTGAAAREDTAGYRSGRSLQLPIYLHAAAALEETALAHCHAEFQYVSERAGYQRLGLAGAQLVADGRFSEVLAAMAEGIAAGAFFYRPSPRGSGRENCHLCDYQDVCHGQVDEYSRFKAPGSKDLTASFDRIAESPRHGSR